MAGAIVPDGSPVHPLTVFNWFDGHVYQLLFESEETRDMMYTEKELLHILIETRLDEGSLQPSCVLDGPLEGMLETYFAPSKEKEEEVKSPAAKKLCQQVTPKRFQVSKEHGEGKIRKSLNFGFSSSKDNDNDVELLATTEQLEACSPFKSSIVANTSNSMVDDSSEATTKSTCVLVEKLPTIFDEDFFVFTIEDLLENADPGCGIKVCETKYIQESNSAILKFPSEHDAQFASHLTIHLDGMDPGTNLILTHLPLVPTAKVVISGTAFPFFEKPFVNMLKKYMKENEMFDFDFVRCFNPDPNSSSVVVEFMSPHVAAEFCRISKPFMFRGLKHHFHQRSVVAMADVYEKTLSKSCSVLVEGLPTIFDKEFFLFTIEDLLENADPGCGIKVCETKYIQESNSAILKFPSEHDAQFASHLTVHMDGMDLGTNLILTHLPKDCESEKEVVTKVPTCEVLVSGTAFPFYEKIFLGMLRRFMTDNGLSESDVVRCGKENPTTSSVVLEFVTPQVARTFCDIQNTFWFRGKCHTFEQKTITSTGKANNPPPVESLDGVQDEGKVTEGPIVFRHDWPLFESAELLKVVNLHRVVVTTKQHKDYKRTWGIITSEMHKKQLYYTEDELKRRLKGLNKYYPESTEKWPFRSLIEEFRGIIAPGTAVIPPECQKQSISTSKKTNQKQSKRKYCGLVVLDNVHVDDDFGKINESKDRLLITEYKKNQHRFNDTHTKASTLYAEMAAVCLKKGYEDLTAEKCCNRLATLAGEFKTRYDKVRHESGVGADPTNWVYYDDFAKLFEGSAILEPQVLVNMGATHSITTRVPASKVHSGRKGHQATKVERVTPPSQKERKVLVGEGLLGEMKRMNDILFAKANQGHT